MAKSKKSSASKNEDVVSSDENTLRFPQHSNTNETIIVEPRKSWWRFHLIIILIGILISLLPVLIDFNFERIISKMPTFITTDELNGQQGCLTKGLKLYTKTELAKHTTASDRIWLGFLGEVFDVTDGQFYHPGGAYAFFSGVDGTRAFLNGQFVKEELRDDITDLEDSYLTGLETWLNMYHEKYRHLGFVIGAYYDEKACPTEKLEMIRKRLTKLKEKEEANENERIRYPPCNSEWVSAENKGRLWCTNLSGGISRSWIGRPRMFYELNHKKWRCACIENEKEEEVLCPDKKPTTSKTSKASVDYDDEDDADDGHGVRCRLKYYPECGHDSIECFIRD